MTRARRTAAVAALLAAVVAIVLPGVVDSNASLTSETGTDVAFTMTTAIPIMETAEWWLDSSFSGTVFQDEACSSPATVPGHPVRCWRNRNNPADVVTSIGTTGPAAVPSTLLNGRRPINFTAPSLLQGPDLFGGSLTDMTVFIVLVANASTNNYVFNLNGLSSTNRFSAHLPWSTGATYFDSGGCCTINRSIGSAPALGTPMMFVGWKDSAVGNSGHKINGGAEHLSPGNDPGITTGGLALGKSSAHNIGEVIVFGRRLSPTEQAAVTDYLSRKWNVPG